METQTAIRKPTPAGIVRWTVVLWLIAGGIINYLDRAVLSIAAPSMITELGLTRTDIGLLGTVFAWTYAVMQLPAGWLIDRLGAKRIFALAMTLWSAATIATGAVSSLAALLASRFVLGIGEAPCFPTFAKLTTVWFPRAERGLAAGLWDSSSKFGPAIAPIVLVNLLVVLGWRPLFYLAGSLGLVYALVFWIFYRDPAAERRLTASERTYIAAGGGMEEQKSAVSLAIWSALFRNRTVWAMIGGYFCTIWIWNIFLVFLPLYLVDRFHLSLSQLGLYASIPWLGGACGEILSGFVGKQVVERGLTTSIDCKRYTIMVCSLLAGVVVAYLPGVTTVWGAIALMTAALFLISAITGSAWALSSDVAPVGLTASVGAIQNFGGYFGGALSPWLTGSIVDRTGSYGLAFTTGAIIAAGAAVFYMLGVRKPIVLDAQ
ncbi:MFS transporter [Lichenifustis flavocetrariae]|uniref:MFS transporter n=1 Tax=Lichenifustis flavocetrariae TaxID=2949735 RepID=A0AA41Z1I2_9HYPH|nr:MFS transporter [Lichenifustis flavocetrariae]MCW6508665.1 MFS transporter [Lichenifustis flavocetrariae]